MFSDLTVFVTRAGMPVDFLSEIHCTFCVGVTYCAEGEIA